jgi:hypothetical protein
MTKFTLLRSAAVGAVLTFGMGVAAHAADSTAPTAAKPVHHKRHPAPAKNPLSDEVAALKTEGAALKAEVASLEQRLDASNAASQQAQAAAAQAQASAQAAQSAAQTQQAAISQIPADVDTAVAKLPKPKTDALYVHGVKVTLGGFIAAEGVYRTRGEGSDFSLPGNSLPYAGSSTTSAHTGEFRETARQSRFSALVEADASENVHLSAYGEFDFLGAAQTANSNESNSYNPRVRNLYTTVDWKNYGLSLLAGQNWSLVTLNDQGITPRNEATPLTIDAQYVAGFVWARQPQIRVTENFGNGLWAAFSVETPATNSIGGSAALHSGVNDVTFNQAAISGSLFNTANSYSFNEMPDLVAKVAYDNTLEGHHVHVEGFGLFRDFYDNVGTGCTSSTSCKYFHNTDTAGGGAGFGVTGQVIPGILDARFSGLFGQGIGRYGSAQMSDVYETSDGALQGIKEGMLLAGLTWHATPKLDVYGYAGQERDSSSSYVTGTTQGGYGNPLFSNLGGCQSSLDLACSGNTKYVQQLVLGFWDKAYTGDFGSLRVGLEYTYQKRESFSGKLDANPLTFGPVSGDDNMIYTSIRYYPFQK